MPKRKKLPQRQADRAVLEQVLAGGGEMGARMRAFDWSQTPLGPPETWSKSLRTILGVLLTSRHPMFLWWGPELVQFYNDGYRPSLGIDRHPAALGARGREFWAEIWPTIGPQVEAVMKRGESTWHEDHLVPIFRNGRLEEVYWTYSYSPVRDDDGTVGGTLVVVQETTSRVIAERRLHTLRDLAARASASRTEAQAWSGAIDVLKHNPRDLPWILLYDLDERGAAQLVGQTLSLTNGKPGTQEALVGGTTWPLQNVLESGKAVLVTDLDQRLDSITGPAWPEPVESAWIVPIRRPGTATLYGLLVAGISPRLGPSPAYLDFLSLAAEHVATAITNARTNEEEQQRLQALAKLDQAKTDFFSNVSHEFRTPLTLMLSPLEDILNEGNGLPPQTRQQLRVAHRNALRLLKLVNTLLDFSRLEAGRLQAAYEPVDLATFTAELASVFRSAIERAGMRFIVNCPPLDEVAYIDTEMWEKVVFNLLSNAFKFTFTGEIVVSLEHKGDQAVLTVRDTGTGIPADELPHLFERFHRVSDARGRTFEGSGIGLALVQELVKLHGGTVQVESELNQGSTFTVSIPLGQAHLPAERIGAARSPASRSLLGEIFVDEALRSLPENGDLPSAAAQRLPQLPPSEVAEEQQAVAPARILLADDNADMREYVRRLLSQRYGEVITVNNGAAALQAAQQTSFDLVLADVMMPQLDGFELLKALRADERTKTLPVILLSARAGEEARIEGMEAGADDYLTKPFSARELLARVGAHLETARIRRQAEEAIRESEERLRLAVRATHDVVWDWNMLNDEVVWSESLHSIFGYPTDQAGTVIHDAFQWWTGHIHPDDQPRIIESFQRAVNASHAEWYEEYRFLRADGTYTDVRDVAFIAFDDKGQPLRIVGAMRDISASKQTQNELKEQALLDSFTAQISKHLIESRELADMLHRCTETLVSYLNAAFARIWILNEKEDVLELQASSGLYTHLDGPHGRVPVGKFKIGRIAAERKPHLTNQVLGDPQVPEQEWVEREGMIAFAGYPLIVEERLIGVMAIFARQPVSDLTLQAMAQVADQIALGVDRKRAEAALRESEERFRNIFEGVGLSIWEEDFSEVKVELDALVEQGVTDFRRYFAEHPEFVERAIGLVRIRDVNPATVRTFGAASRTELLQSLDRIFVPETTAAFVEELITVAEKKQLFEAETVLQTLHGEPLHVLFTITFPPPDQPFDRVLVTLTDITARKAMEDALRESEERFRHMADHAPVMIWVTEPDATCTYLSKSWYEFTGQTPETGLGLGWLQAVHPDDRKRSEEIFIAANERYEAFRLEYRLRRYDGEYRWAIDSAAPRFDPNGEFRGYIGSVIDITERKQAEVAERLLAEMRERNRLAQELHDTVAQALGYLNLKIGLTHSLLTGNDIDSAKLSLQELKQVINETYTDVREEIFYLRAKALSDLSFMELLNRYIDKYHRFYNLNIQLFQEAEPASFEFPPEVTSQLIRTIQEALINVRKHAQVNRATIRLNQSNGDIHISIEDTGQGFDLAKSREKTTSFGLQIMRERVESVGGRLKIETTPGQGTRIVLHYRQSPENGL